MIQRNRLTNSDALAFLKSLPDKCCDIFTDPPYNVGKDYGDMVDDNRSDYPEYIKIAEDRLKRHSYESVYF